MSWTDERIETLKSMASRGCTAREIADTLGDVTRNAVIGKLNRISKNPDAPQKAEVKAVKPARPAGEARRVRTPFRPPSAPRAVVAPGESAATTFLGLEAHMCRWPIGDPATNNFGFCGVLSSGGPYCARHTRQAYRPAQVVDLSKQLGRYLNR